MKSIKDYIWDFDGTLYDSYPLMSLAMYKALRDLGQEADIAEIKTYMKDSVFAARTAYCKRFGLDDAELAERFRFYHSDVSRFRPYEGAKECLEGLKNAGCRSFLYTHRGATANFCLERDGLIGYFTELVTSQNGFPDKPAPDAIQYLMEKYSIDPNSAVMIGDRAIDLQSGENAGIGTVLFDPDGYYPNVKAGRRIDKLTELLS